MRLLLTRPPLHAALLALLVLVVVVPRAAANVPAPITKTNSVRDEGTGMANGELTTRVTYTDTAATAAAATGDTIGLKKGFDFLLRTCVAYHLHATTPLSNCAERRVDTRSNTVTVYTGGPSVTLSGQVRPTTQPWGYFTAYADVLRSDGTTWLLSAHSWPDNGLQSAGIAVAAQGQDGGVLPANSAVTVGGAFTGAINSGQPDGICTASLSESNGSALPAGVSSSHPAYSGAPA